MKYFTPELYARFRSADRADAIRAHDEWEAAIEAYRQHLSQVEERMTTNVRNVALTLCLHDADYLGMAVVPTPDVGKPLAVLLTRQEATRTFLVYLLVAEPMTKEVACNWPFSREQVHWLYDEFDADNDGIQQHEVLLSNGQTVTLRFQEMQVIQHKVEEPALAAQL